MTRDPMPTPSVVPEPSRGSTPKWLGVTAGAFVVLGALLVLVTIPLKSMLLVLVAGLGIAALAWLRPPSTATGVGILLLSVGAGWLSLANFGNLSQPNTALLGTTEIGVGLLMTFVGEGLGNVTGITTLSKTPRPAQPTRHVPGATPG